jgi:hypothetical protein
VGAPGEPERNRGQPGERGQHRSAAGVRRNAPVTGLALVMTVLVMRVLVMKVLVMTP